MNFVEETTLDWMQSDLIRIKFNWIGIECFIVDSGVGHVLTLRYKDKSPVNGFVNELLLFFLREHRKGHFPGDNHNI